MLIKLIEPLFLTFDLGPGGLAHGAIQLVYCDAGKPERWGVMLVPTTDANLVVYVGRASRQFATGVPIRLGSGGSFVFPATNEYITIVNAGTATAYGTILALRGYEFVKLNPSEAVS